jgi:tetratricopeptide (TPR) repeat protein
VLVYLTRSVLAQKMSASSTQVVIFCLCCLLCSCSRDPNVRKQKYLKSGETYADQGKYPEAVIQFENALRIDPNYAEAHFQLGEACIKLQQPDRAEQELARAVELDGGIYQARMEHANLLILTKDFQEAQSDVDVLLRDHGDDPGVHAIASSLLAAEGDLPGAIKEMQAAVSLAPDRWESRLSLAALQLKNNQPDNAEISLKTVIQLNPAAAQPHFILGSYYQGRGQLDSAEQQFEQAIKLDKNNPDFRAALARVYLAEGKPEKAEDFLRRAKADFPDNSAGYRLLGDFYFASGDIDRALAEYDALRTQHVKDLALEKNYVELLIQKGRFSDAQPLIEAILKQSPNDGDALVFRSQLQIAQGRASDCIGTLQTVIKNDPNNSEAHYVLGVALEGLGHPEQAIAEWQEAVRLRPDLLDAQQALALAAMRKGDNNGLQEAATRLIALRPGSPDGYALRALSNINRDRFEAAEKDARQAIAISPQSAAGYIQMGNLNLAQKRYAEAADYFRKALERNPNSIDGLRGLVQTDLGRRLPDAAVRDIGGQLAKAPQNSQFHALLAAVLYREKGDAGGAERAFNEAIRLDANNADAVIGLGKMQAAEGKMDSAIALLENYLKAHPRQFPFQLLLGQLFERNGAPAKAEEAYQSALVIKPDDPFASEGLANVLANEGKNFDQALLLAQSAQRGLPDSPAVAETIGWIYYRKGAYATAINFLQQAIRLRQSGKLPDSANVHYRLGLAYAKSDQPQSARHELERVLKIDPNFSAAEDVKRQLAQLKS